ncbi:MAG: DUF3617 domain-containing protein [Desulfuromonas sp.]|nr:DUF3617 domain-containing protein [Desulfuromonas sp.]
MVKMKMLIAQLVVLLLALSLVQSCLAMDVEEGLWEMTTRMEMPGMPMQMPAITFTDCLTEDDVIPQDSQCEVTDLVKDGNTIRYTMHCNQDGQQMTAKGEFTYSGKKMSGKVVTQMSEQMSMTTVYNGHWIGPCK